MFERITKVRLPFDMRNADGGKNYGIHGMDIWFILKGEKGAVQFAFTVHTFLPHVEAQPDFKSFENSYFGLGKFSGLDVGYHAKVPQYEDQPCMECDTLDGNCYYDGSALRADEWVKEIFSERGRRPEDLLWKKLEEEYSERFRR